MGATPDKEFDGFSQWSQVLPRQKTVDFKFVYRAFMHRITMKSVSSASGECGPILFVFKDSFTFRNVVRDGIVYT